MSQLAAGVCRPRVAGVAQLGLVGLLGVAALYALAIAFGLASGPRHDYVTFLRIWGSIADGGSAWPAFPGRASKNVYGPVFSFMGPLVKIHPMAPKWLFTTAWFGLALWLHSRCEREGSARARWAVPAILLLHPYFWVDVPYFGHFDVVVAACCVLGVDALNRGREARAGVWLALGGCLKLHPFLLIPFLAIGRERLRLRFVGAAASFTALAYGLSGLWFGSGASSALGTGATRESKIMSIFRFLRGEYSPLGLLSDAPNVDDLSTPLLGAALLGLLALHLRRRFDTTGVAVLALTVILGLYAVGHPQLYFPLMALVGYWWLRCPDRFSNDSALCVTAVLLCAWVTTVGALYPLLDDFRGEWAGLREWLGLPTFALMVAFAASVWRSLQRDRSA